MTLEEALKKEVSWRANFDNLDFPYISYVDNSTWVLTLNSSPDEDIWGLIIDAVSIGRFNDWPVNWTRVSRASDKFNEVA
ncbi:MAG: hypothetical protein AAB784_02695 [Patescibacteria group bacterium]